MKTLQSLTGVLLVSLMLSCNNNNNNNLNDEPFKGKDLFSTVEKYVGLGEHRTGTATDTATSFWLGQELSSYGYNVKYLEFPVREFFPEKVFLANGKDTIQAFPLWWVNEAISREVTGILSSPDSGLHLDKKNIALIHLPLPGKRSYENTEAYIDSLAGLGVTGIVAITDNQSGEIQAYNTNTNSKPWKVPVILIAPKDSASAQAFVKAATRVTLAINGTFRDVKGRNVYGTIGSGEEYIVISTPISGWFTCGGERGSGLAIWLALAKWAAAEKSRYTFVFTGNSGHEHAFMGAHQYLETAAPPKEKTHLWLHFGAGAATLKWTASDTGLVRQSVVDGKRRFFYNEAVSASFNKAFDKVDAEKIQENDNPGGELLYVARKGYTRFAGVTYSHPFFHVKTDDANTTSPEILESTALAFRNFIAEEIK